MSRIAATALLATVSLPAFAVPGSEPQSAWGIAIGARYADIPYDTDVDQVMDITPLMYFHTERFYLHGLEAGFHLWNDEKHQATLFSRYRFFDIPEEYQNEVREDSFDTGLRYRYIPWDNAYLDAEVLSDGSGRSYGHFRYGFFHQEGALEVRPTLQIDWRSEQFNSYYYGLDRVDAGADLGATVGFELRYHVWSNLYLMGSANASILGGELADLPTLDSRYNLETFIGFGFFPEPSERGKLWESDALEGHYVRLATGWATESNIGEILAGDRVKDPYGNQLTSVFWGLPLTNELFGLPIDIYFTPGLIYHHSSEVQDPTYEGVLAVKAYYNFDWPIRWRIGVAEGLSYVDEITYIEQIEMDRKGYRPSNLMNYLDLSFGANLGDLFGIRELDPLWLGYSLHHRSSIFETASQFGRIKGGSNYNTVYLQWHF
ncbi:MipA/OmpV family protein [Ferrimonas balearica]|uniref:MipA/OmpV family protein n=1 Tax=Ferrimonas balearica TaxID=44012 RepID=UPI001C5914BA|nr:MipA/OmpV family protein [Ferrimonas balearica]MBW3140918.1 MipA/OmpV family protein [Ferrimonas balearica]MBY5981789.1 MipA/OmpV family protein [Ferrimonas balearica]MBY6108057.1 MipA/OmpV family protein [Ferrimonas balearica]MBY6225398.1 MipA/OmpV family protein [Ferrimonas balearica]